MATGELLTFEKPIGQIQNIGFRPATAIYEHIKEKAGEMGISMNHYCNLAFAEFLKKKYKVSVENDKNLKRRKRKAL